MKMLKRSFVIFALCFICVLAFSGCNTKKCDGSIKDFYVDGEYIYITFSETHHQNYYLYPIICILKSDFSKYSCKNLSALLTNEEFISDHKRYTTIFIAQPENGPNYKRHDNLTNLNSYSYWLFYDYLAADTISEVENLPEDFFNVKDIANYTGYIKF